MKSITTVLLVALSLVARLSAADVNPVEAKLRESLRDTMIKLRDAQGAKVTLETEKATLEQKVEALTTQLDSLTKQLAEEKTAAEKRITEQQLRIDERAKEAAKLEEELLKLQKSYKEAAALAAKKEAERAKVNSEKIVLERKVADQQVKNTKMFEIGNEILGRYEKFGLGTAIASREPFVGLTRIKLKNMFQELGDKLADQKIKP